jgi:hypothetical protein
VVTDAWPSKSEDVPTMAVPSKNVTVPVAAEGVTVAVRVCGWPSIEGAADRVRTSVVAAGIAVEYARGAETLP